MYYFCNDYSEGAHPKILEKMMTCNLEQNIGYGEDSYSIHAKELIKEKIQNKDAEVHFLVGGTQTNLTIISAALRPHEAVIAASTGHIFVHETGAIEATGHKVIAVETLDGKLTPTLIQKVLDIHTDEHMVKPKMVYLSDSTEVGTIYKKEELRQLFHVCKKNDLYLFLDGARLASALTSEENDISFGDIGKWTDVCYIGGTKNGALFGEAVVINHPELKKDFRYIIKQKGGMLAKGWLLGLQFETLLEQDLYFELGRHANKMADILKNGLLECGYSFQWDSCTNQLFPIFRKEELEKIQEEFDYTYIEQIEKNYFCIRLVTSWATKETECQKFVELLYKLKYNKDC